MSFRVPVIYHDKDSFLHRRDPRVKLLLLAVLVVFIYLAPTWQWMLGMAFIGLAMAAVAKLSWKWVLVLSLLQIPNLLGVLFFPAMDQFLAGDFSFTQEFQNGVKLASAWIAALFVSVSLFATMTTDEMTDGMRGLKLPEVVCFIVGYTFLLIYLSFSDVIRVADAMKIKGVELELKKPLRLIAGMPRLMIPAILVIVRRAPTMMSVLQIRGFSFKRTKQVEMGRLDVPDLIVLAIGLGILAATAAAEVGLISLYT